MKYLIVVVLLVAAVFTCPKAEDHQAEMSSILNQVMKQKIENADNALVGVVGTLFGGHVIDAALGKLVEVQNYYVCSIGQVEIDGKMETVSVGVFNHVFTFGEDDVERVIEDAQRKLEKEGKQLEKEGKKLLEIFQ